MSKKRSPKIRIQVGSAKYFVTAEMIGERFAEIVTEWLAPSDLAKLREMNRGRKDGECCANDFCDANVAMLRAFDYYGIDPLAFPLGHGVGMVDAIDAIWNSAWNFARVRYFTAEEPKLPRCSCGQGHMQPRFHAIGCGVREKQKSKV